MLPVSYRPKNISTVSSIGILGILCLAICVGQFARIPLARQGGGLLVSDVGTIIILGYGLCAALLGIVPIRKIVAALGLYNYIAIPFFLFASSVLVVRGHTLGMHSFFIAFLYIIRLFAVSLLFPLLSVFISAKAAQKAFVYMYCVLIALGYAQLIVFPSLVGNMNGWDPHIHRMVATWFDPNFFGAFVAMGLAPALYWARGSKILFFLSIGALALTGSRSSWIAAIAAVIVTVLVFLLRGSLVAYWKKGAILAMLGTGIITIGVCGVFFDRISHFFVHDPTVELRATAYADVWHRLVEPNIFFGVGYNAYQFAAKDAGLIQDFSIHSRAGSDNSVVTLLVTTGIIGTIFFFIPFVTGFYWHAKNWLLYARAEPLLFIWALTTLIVHSQFENSLLYPHLLMTFIIIAVAAL